MLFLFLELPHHDRKLIWKHYGVFTALIFCGSCSGIITWSSWMQYLTNNYIGMSLLHEPSEDRFVFFARAENWYAAHRVTYAVEFLCLSVANLLVLDRMAGFSMPNAITTARVVVGAISSANVVGLIGNCVTAAYHVHTAAYWTKASAAHSLSANSSDVEDLREKASALTERTASLASVQSFSEVAALAIIVASFIVVGLHSIRRIRLAISDVPDRSTAFASGMQMQRDVVITVSFSFFAFVLRCLFSSMFAIALQLQNVSAKCPGATLDDSHFCAPCYNDYMHLWEWMDYTPVFRLLIILISSPMSLLVALWGMTSRRYLQLMRRNKLSDHAPPQLTLLASMHVAA
jgi:hypothetical protein